MRYLKKIHFFISCLPYTWVVLTYLAIIDPLFKLGRLPVYRIDAIEMTFGKYIFNFSIIIMVLMYWSFPVWLGMAIYLARNRLLDKKTVIIYIAGIALYFLLGKIDPYGLLDWLYD